MDQSPQGQGPDRAFSVHELVRQIREYLEYEFTSVWVTGEISNLRTPQSGHTYFTLKDADAQIPAVFFRNKKRYIRFEPEDGLAVLCKGIVTVYEMRGSMQLSIDYMEPVGLGALYLAFEQIKERLEKEGLFDPAHKKKLPLLPRRIGVITSPTGAAIQDILNIINRRFADVQILIAPVRVQGDSAAGEIVEALENLNHRGDLDVIILSRGGGSMEDLWPFNEEAVARTIFASPIPVISAVGHETDFTIADFVADFRAPTPSAAAEVVVQNKADMLYRIEQLARRLRSQMVHALERHRTHAEQLARRLVTPAQRLGMLQQRLDDLTTSLIDGSQRRLADARERLARHQSALRLLSPRQTLHRLGERHRMLHERLRRSADKGVKGARDAMMTLSSRLHGLSPLNVLARGYSIVYRLPEREIIRDVKKLVLQDRVRIRFHRGEAEGTLDFIEEGKRPN